MTDKKKSSTTKKKSEKQKVSVLRTTMSNVPGQFPTDRESPDSKSVTVPGMVEPLKDLVERWVKGREIPVLQDAVFEGHLDVPDVRLMDKVEKAEYSKAVRKGIAEMQEKLQKANEQKELDKVAELEKKIKELEGKATVEMNPESSTGSIE